MNLNLELNGEHLLLHFLPLFGPMLMENPPFLWALELRNGEGRPWFYFWVNLSSVTVCRL